MRKSQEVSENDQVVSLSLVVPLSLSTFSKDSRHTVMNRKCNAFLNIDFSPTSFVSSMKSPVELSQFFLEFLEIRCTLISTLWCSTWKESQCHNMLNRFSPVQDFAYLKIKSVNLTIQCPLHSPRIYIHWVLFPHKVLTSGNSDIPVVQHFRPTTPNFRNFEHDFRSSLSPATHNEICNAWDRD